MSSLIKTKLVRLYAGQSETSDSAQFQCFFNTAQLNNIRGLSLKTCTFQNNHPNIFADDLYLNHVNNNNVFSYLVGAVTHSTTIPITGFYSLTDVLDAINPDLQTNFVAQNPGATAILELDDVTGKVKLSTTGVVLEDITLSGGINSLNAYVGNINEIALTAYPYGFENFPSLSGAKLATVSLKTKSPQTILNADISKERHTNSIGSIPISVPYLAQQTYVDPSPADTMLKFEYPETLRKVEFVIRDEFGRAFRSQNLNFGLEILVHTSS